MKGYYFVIFHFLTCKVSSTCASLLSNLFTVFVISNILSANVDFPWSICAIMLKFRIRSRGID